MANPGFNPNGFDAAKGVMEKMQTNAEEVAKAWTQGYESYTQWMATVSKARGPEDIMAANAQFLTSGLDQFAKTLTTLANMSATASPFTPKDGKSS